MAQAFNYKHVKKYCSADINNCQSVVCGQCQSILIQFGEYLVVLGKSAHGFFGKNQFAIFNNFENTPFGFYQPDIGSVPLL
jgi:hypothetical protein